MGTRIVEFDLITKNFSKLILPDFKLNPKDPNKIYWVHCDLKDKNTLDQIADIIKLPEHVINLCYDDTFIPKLIDNSESVTIQVEPLLQTNFEDREVFLGNLVFHLTSQYCFTASGTQIPAVDGFEENYSKYVKYAKTPCFILFLILDNVVNDFSKLLLDFEILADQIDLEIRVVQDNIYNEVMNFKKQVMKVQHHIAAIRDILMRISGRKITAISEECRLSLRSLLDHSQIIFNEAEAVRDSLRSTLDQIDNALMQKMNDSIRVLTAFASIFLPLTLISGIYGMNFTWIPELHWKYGYFWSLFLMLGCGLFLYYFFKIKKWF